MNYWCAECGLYVSECCQGETFNESDGREPKENIRWSREDHKEVR